MMTDQNDATPSDEDGPGTSLPGGDESFWAVFNFRNLVYPTVSFTKADAITRGKENYGEESWAGDGESECLFVREFSLDELGTADSIGVRPYLSKLRSRLEDGDPV